MSKNTVNNKGGAATAQRPQQQLTAVCKVCSSPARSHSHYGAVCCYSCRAFFRRAVNQKYSCLNKTEKCEITPENRTVCKFCRFKKCLEIGMKPGLVETNCAKMNGAEVMCSSVADKGCEESRIPECELQYFYLDPATSCLQPPLVVEASSPPVSAPDVLQTLPLQTQNGQEQVQESLYKYISPAAQVCGPHSEQNLKHPSATFEDALRHPSTDFEDALRHSRTTFENDLLHPRTTFKDASKHPSPSLEETLRESTPTSVLHVQCGQASAGEILEHPTGSHKIAGDSDKEEITRELLNPDPMELIRQQREIIQQQESLIRQQQDQLQLQTLLMMQQKDELKLQTQNHLQIVSSSGKAPTTVHQPEGLQQNSFPALKQASRSLQPVDILITGFQQRTPQQNTWSKPNSAQPTAWNRHHQQPQQQSSHLHLPSLNAAEHDSTLPAGSDSSRGKDTGVKRRTGNAVVVGVGDDGSRVVKVRRVREPYLEFTADEQLLVRQLMEGRKKIESDCFNYFVRCESKEILEVAKAFEDLTLNRVQSWGDYDAGVDKMNQIFLKALSEMGHVWIPSRFGSFPANMFVRLVASNLHHLHILSMAAFFAKSNSCCSLYQQEIEPNPYIDNIGNDWVEANFGHLKNVGTVSQQDITLFMSPWCSSLQDEEFFNTTLEQLGELQDGDPVVRDVLALIVCVMQTEGSPFSKSKEVERLNKSLVTLLSRYLFKTLGSTCEAHTRFDNIVNIINKLPRCADIYLNKRIMY